MEAKSKEAKKIGSKKTLFYFCFLSLTSQYEKAIEEAEDFLGSKKIMESLNM